MKGERGTYRKRELGPAQGLSPRTFAPATSKLSTQSWTRGMGLGRNEHRLKPWGKGTILVQGREDENQFQGFSQRKGTWTRIIKPQFSSARALGGCLCAQNNWHTQCLNPKAVGGPRELCCRSCRGQCHPKRFQSSGKYAKLMRGTIINLIRLNSK